MLKLTRKTGKLSFSDFGKHCEEKKINCTFSLPTSSFLMFSVDTNMVAALLFFCDVDGIGISSINF